MRNLILVFASLCLLVTLTVAQSSHPRSPSEIGSGAAEEPELPYSPSLDLTSMDKSVDPCADFYQYSCGGWQKKNPIPPDQVSWSVYGKLYQDNLQFLRGILEEAERTQGRRDAVTQKIGRFLCCLHG